MHRRRAILLLPAAICLLAWPQHGSNRETVNIPPIVEGPANQPWWLLGPEEPEEPVGGNNIDGGSGYEAAGSPVGSSNNGGYEVVDSPVGGSNSGGYDVINSPGHGFGDGPLHPNSIPGGHDYAQIGHEGAAAGEAGNGQPGPSQANGHWLYNEPGEVVSNFALPNEPSQEPQTAIQPENHQGRVLFVFTGSRDNMARIHELGGIRPSFQALPPSAFGLDSLRTSRLSAFVKVVKTYEAAVAEFGPRATIYIVSATPNMVPVVGTTGPGTRLGALAGIATEQIYGWLAPASDMTDMHKDAFDLNQPDSWRRFVVRSSLYDWRPFGDTAASNSQPQLADFPPESEQWLVEPFREVNPWLGQKSPMDYALEFAERVKMPTGDLLDRMKAAAEGARPKWREIADKTRARREQAEREARDKQEQEARRKQDEAVTEARENAQRVRQRIVVDLQEEASSSSSSTSEFLMTVAAVFGAVIGAGALTATAMGIAEGGADAGAIAALGAGSGALLTPAQQELAATAQTALRNAAAPVDVTDAEAEALVDELTEAAKKVGDRQPLLADKRAVSALRRRRRRRVRRALAARRKACRLRSPSARRWPRPQGPTWVDWN